MTQETEEGVVIDPCTPRGYRWSVEEGQHHAVSISTGTHSPVSSILSQGNFSECRSAAYSLLQKDHGTSDLNLSQCTEKETQPEREREREKVFGEKIVGMIDFSSSCLHGNLPWPLRVLWSWEQMPAHTQNVQ